MTQQKRQELIRAFRNYADAHARLLKQWQRADLDDLESYFTDQYPFKLSFCDLMASVNEWRDKSIAFLNGEVKKTKLTFDELRQSDKIFDASGVVNPRDWYWERRGTTDVYYPSTMLVVEKPKESGDDVQVESFAKRVSRMAGMEITSLGHLKEFIRLCIADDGIGLGLGFHPDTPFDQYVIHTGETLLHPYQAALLDDKLSVCFEICKIAEVDIYAIGIDIWKQLKMLPS